ncbi:RecX family transcriptional regulator [Peptoniphilus sp. KCTC 25270]|uniref:RecX family transcriptional regulator n=1 Tax=Peptoniphilus sp. KCTC 25270 TaxID=2897414 RepID=UPI001E625DD4|nr:RecX family transcriptional regulator [Peptoniphilus sp. KCTC 25270]MCD1147028.1 RecX family transcriptional regulator [Peptoniphilus sp. KCTC 25270]
MEILRIVFNKNKYRIELSNEQIIEVVESVFVRFNLYKGKELDLFDIQNIQKDSKKQEAIDFSLRKLRNRKTEHEIFCFLEKEDFEEEAISEAIDYLKKYNFINDEEYANLYVRDKMNINLYGPLKIQSSLKMKGISNEQIQDSLNQYTEEHLLENIEKLMYKKYRRNHYLDFKDKQKMMQYFYQRGFSPSMLENYWRKL